ncbi:MAG UNVERIFIED_CONTAM: hypothetical protein LVQ98_08175 [Rickettsiaceae bacterium]|jgi:hypothetical protein
MLKAVLGLIFVIALLYIMLKIMQKYLKPSYKINDKDIINITGIAYIDESTKIISASHGPSKYVFVVGKGTSLLLDKYENHKEK